MIVIQKKNTQVEEIEIEMEEIEMEEIEMEEIEMGQIEIQIDNFVSKKKLKTIQEIT